jgi:hypothetical protein
VRKLFLFFLGLICIGFWIEFIALDVQATEAFFNGGTAVLSQGTLDSTWSVIMQVPDVLLGSVDLHVKVIICIGWGVELIYAICVAGYQICHSAVGYHNPHLAGIFRNVGLGIIAFCLWTTGNYGSNLDFWGHLAFATITGFCSAFLGIAGIALLENVAVSSAKSAPATAK